MPCIDFECLPELAERPWWWNGLPGGPEGPIDPKARLLDGMRGGPGSLSLGG